MNKSLILYFASLTLLCNSCKSIVTHIATNRSMVKNAYYLQKGNQKVIFVPMVHMSKPKNFEDVKNFINEKRQLGYKIYYEKVTYDKDSANFEEVSLKMRKLTGLTFGQNFLNDEQRAFHEKANDKKYVWQSNVDYGVDFKNDIHADYTLSSLVKAFEERYSEVKLQSCDYNTPLNASYTCGNPKYYQEVVQDLRNAKLLRHILQDTINKKKLIVYGLGHYYSGSGVFNNLCNRNQYEEVKARHWKD